MTNITKIPESTRQIFTVLLKKLTKDELITSLISAIEATCPTTTQRTEIIKMISVFVHSKEVLTGEKRIEDFTSPLREEIEKNLASLRRNEK